MPHLDPGLLHELLDGEVPSTELAPIRDHLAACEECRTRLEHERQLLTDVDGLVAAIEVPTPGRRRLAQTSLRKPSRSWQPLGLAWAATVLLAAGLGYFAGGMRLVPLAGRDHVIPIANYGTRASKPMSPRSDSGVAIASAQRPRADRESASAPHKAVAFQSRKADSVSSARAAGASQNERRDELAGRSLTGASAPNQPAAGAIAVAPPAEGHPLPGAKSTVASATPNEPVARAATRSVQTIGTLDNARSTSALLAREVSGTRHAADSVVTTTPISLPDAMGRLGGTIRLIDGMVPIRLELREPYVRVVYPAAQGELVLQQQLIDGRVVYQIIPPRGFPADSLARLRSKVKE